jgi:hypothetical protein
MAPKQDGMLRLSENGTVHMSESSKALPMMAVAKMLNRF